MFGLRMMARMKADVLGVYTQLHHYYGDCVSFRTGPFRLFIFYHPDHVREVLVRQARSLIRFPRVMETFAQWNGNSMLIAEGDDWVRQRRLVQPAFQPRRFEEYGRVMVAAAQRLMDSWQPQLAQAEFMDLDVDRAMTRLTLEIICKTLFDADVTDETHDISRAVAILSEVAYQEMQSVLRLPLWWPTPFQRRKRWAIRTLDEFLWRLVRGRRAEPHDRGDLLSVLLTAVDEEGDGDQLDDRQVRNETATLMLAGHDTTAAALDWLWYCLARYPEVAQKCQAEIDATVGSRAPGARDVGSLKYLEATIREVLRLYPPAVSVFLRQATADLTIGDYDVPRGSLLTVSSYVTHRDRRWFEDPTRFDPERFLPPRADSIPAGAYFPFGAGPRVCVGQSFAMTEMLLLAAALLQQFTVSLPPDEPEPVPQVVMALRPRDKLTLRWKRRSPDARRP